jgi:hypothetical protein
MGWNSSAVFAAASLANVNTVPISTTVATLPAEADNLAFGVIGPARTLFFNGSLADINTALAGLVFVPDEGWNSNMHGFETVAVTVRDPGHGKLKSTSVSTNMTVHVLAVNNPPRVTCPLHAIAQEGVPLLFQNISVFDKDASETFGAVLELELSVSSGTLSLSSTAGLYVSSGVSTGAASLTFQAGVEAANLALASLSYTGAQNSSVDSLIINVSDMGNSGSGGVKTTTANVSLVIEQLNHPPAVSMPADFMQIEEDTVTAITGINVVDADIGTKAIAVSLSVKNGTIKVASGVNIQIVNNSLFGGTLLMLRGSISDVNAALTSVTYTPFPNFSGDEVFHINASDGALATAAQSSADIIIRVLPVNDAPVLVCPPGLRAVAVHDSNGANDHVQLNVGDRWLVNFKCNVSDVDSDDLRVWSPNMGRLTMNLSVVNGELSLPQAAVPGLELNSSPLGSSSFVPLSIVSSKTLYLTGTLLALQKALDTVLYRASGTWTGQDVLTIVADDGGNTGSGGAKMVSTQVDVIAPPAYLSPEISTPSSGHVVVLEGALSPLAGFTVTVQDAQSGTQMYIVYPPH